MEDHIQQPWDIEADRQQKENGGNLGTCRDLVIIRWLVISGDTRPSENLIRHARGCDVLVHETFPLNTLKARAPKLFNSKRWEAILAHHTMPDQAGEVFSRVKPKLAVFSHYADDRASRDELARDLIPAARKNYSGPLEVGRDLMVIEVGEQVTVLPAAE